jgi:hypothetical protein
MAEQSERLASQTSVDERSCARRLRDELSWARRSQNDATIPTIISFAGATRRAVTGSTNASLAALQVPTMHSILALACTACGTSPIVSSSRSSGSRMQQCCLEGCDLLLLQQLLQEAERCVSMTLPLPLATAYQPSWTSRMKAQKARVDKAPQLHSISKSRCLRDVPLHDACWK